VVRIIDWGATDDGIWYYAMELLEGADLATLVAQEGPLSPRVVVHIGLQAARALGAAHAAGIVHRDIKPANLFVIDRQGAMEIKVLDFGIARVEGNDGLTRTGALIGTPAFMAPEATRGKPAGRASDVWSLAATLRYAATAKMPHEAGTTEGPAPELAALLDVAMAPDPADRPADGNAFAAALAATSFAGGGPVLAPVLASRKPLHVDAEAPTVAPER
jgi:serine/threonine-protein kinase